MLRATGIDGSKIPTAPNQSVTLGSDSHTITILSQPGANVTGEERSAALLSTASIDSASPQIQKQAAKLKAGVTDRRQLATRIGSWVAKTVKPRLSTHLTSASAVLDSKYGDCTEFTLLFVALARAAGLPAREVYGLVYGGDKLKHFVWHAWAEVDIDGRWVQVDPSWNEPVANASHIRFGGDDASYIQVVIAGTLKLEVIEVMPR